MKKLAIIGASYLQLPLVRKAREMNIETHCFAWADGAVCKDECDFFYPISVLDKEGILKICESVKPDAITTIATDIAVPTICHVAAKLKLVANSEQSAAASTNKGLMRESFEKSDVSSPKFVSVTSYDYQRLQTLQFPLIVKPADRSGSRGVSKVSNEAELEAAVKTALDESIAKQAVVEEFITGDEISVETISWHGHHYILAITDKVTTGSPHFVELAHHQPSMLSEKIQDTIKSETLKVLDAVGIRFGAGHAEFKINADGDVFAIEVGARMGGDFIGSHLVQLSTGYDFLKGVIDVALNRFTEPEVKSVKNSGIYFLCEETKGLLPYFEAKTDFEVEKEMQHTVLQNVKSSNDRSGYLIYQASNKIQLL